jgi:hypothetical protein
MDFPQSGFQVRWDLRTHLTSAHLRKKNLVAFRIFEFSYSQGQKRTFTRIVEFLRSLFCCRQDREPAYDLNLPVRLDGMFGQERKNETGDFIVLLVQGEMAGVE